MADQLNMENRDANDLNSHIKVAFDEVFGEPDGVHSLDGVWRCSYTCFTCTLSCCYKLLTILCAVPLAFCWACEFACTACYHIWYFTPCMRIEVMNLMACRKILEVCLNTFLGPCVETCALCFSKISVANK